MGAAKQAMLEEMDKEPKVECMRCGEDVPVSDASDSWGPLGEITEKEVQQKKEEGENFLCSYCIQVSR